MQAWAGLGYYSRARNLHACAQVLVGPARRPLSGDGGGAPQAARHRRLHGGGDRRHRLQPAGRRRRRQCRAGRLASLSRRGAAAGRQGGHQGAHRIARPDGPAGRFRASLDGPRRHHVHAEAAGLRAMPVDGSRAAPAPPACKRAFRASRRRRKGRCGAGPPSWRFAPTPRFSCAPGPPRVSSAAWPSRRRAPGRRITIRDGAVADAPVPAEWRRLAGIVRHTFTHFPLELTVFAGAAAMETAAPAGMRWTPRAALAEEALPNVMKKVLAHALDTRASSSGGAKAETRGPQDV